MSDLFVGTVGASAALAGLVFVGISINLAKIVALQGIPERGLEAIGLRFGVLVMSTLALVPQRVLAPGIELLAAALAEAVGLEVLNVAQWRRLDRRFRVRLMVHAALGQAAVLLFAPAGRPCSWARAEAGT
ncbi:MAG TPA: hypothetical protein VFD01_22005 [Candidatus Dormibacteraeota bacterium]|nr:hypothetical protein [Candidatus Dormibacteraeota bacterium]